MKAIKDILCILLLLFSASAITISCQKGGDTYTKTKSPTISGEDYDPNGGADYYHYAGDNPRSNYYVNRDIYSLSSNDTITILSHFKTMQQTTEWSCGDVAALMVLHHFDCGDNISEWDMAVALHSHIDSDTPNALPGSAKKHSDYGTKLKDLYNYFNSHATLKVISTSYQKTYTDDDLIEDNTLYPECDLGNLAPTFDSSKAFAVWLTSQLKANHPIMAEWSDWDGHWIVLIGIDNNGTPNYYGDDILILADSYDTTDHWQDGYTIASLDKFFYSWKDRAIAPKPYQLQPYIAIGKR